MTSVAGPPLSVVVITCNRPALCSALVALLLGQLRDDDELLLVDDDRVPGHTHPSDVSKVIKTRGRGAGGARNAALCEAANEWIVFLDDDVVPPSAFLTLVRQRLPDGEFDVLTANVRCDDSCGEAGVLFDERYPLSRGTSVTTYRGCTGTRATPNDVWRVGAGAAMIWRSAALHKIGGFAEDIGQGRRYGGAEDLAAFRAALQAGYTIRYDGTLLVHHLSPTTIAEFRAKMCGYALADGALASHVWLTQRDTGMIMHLLRDVARSPLTFISESLRALRGKTHLPLAPVAAFPWRVLHGLLGYTVLHMRHQ